MTGQGRDLPSPDERFEKARLGIIDDSMIGELHAELERAEVEGRRAREESTVEERQASA